MTQQPLFRPPSDWKCPTAFPDLSQAKIIGFDIESRDDRLRTHGPGFVRNEADVIGVSLAVETGESWYFPVRHAEGPNLPPNAVFDYLRDTLRGPQMKVGARVLYDLEGLWKDGVRVGGKIRDVQVTEALLDEESQTGYSLNALSKKWLGRVKNEELLRAAASAWGIDPKSEMWKLPPQYVGPYAESDALLPIRILEKQLPQIEKEELTNVFELEHRLIPLLLEMRIRGVRVDLDRAQGLVKDLKKKESAVEVQIKQLTNLNVDVWSSIDLAKAYKALGIAHPYTNKGNPSFTAPWLEIQKDALSGLVRSKRKMERLRTTFIGKNILEMNYRGRIHCEFHQLAGDEDGTRTGRFSSSCPNLQQVPARDEVWAELIRSLFIPEEGCFWAKSDYSQQEPRVTVHYAFLRKLKGSEEAVKRFKERPDYDYHQMVADICAEVLGDSTRVPRKTAKVINLGIPYAMGLEKLCITLAVDIDQGREISDGYNLAVPYAKGLLNECSLKASARGWIRTLSGRRCRFNLWEPANRDLQERLGLPREKAEARWPGQPLTRAFTYKALNRLIQGSSADMIKEAMVQLWEGFGMVQHLTVHDELDNSLETVKQARQMREVMENCVNLMVPIRTDFLMGSSWGAAKEVLPR